MGLAEFIYTTLLRPRPLRKAANLILLALLPRTVRVGAAVVHLHPRDPVVSGALLLRCYEREEIAFCRKIMRPGMVFVDVGANVGLYSALALRAGARQVVCVEPSPDTLPFLRRTLEANCAPGARCDIFEGAAAEAPGEVRLYQNPENRGDNRLYPDPLCSAPPLAVRCDTLDALAERLDIPQADMIKVDVQGAEGRVLAGAQRLLAHSPNCVVMTEFWPYGLERCGTCPREFLEGLASQGYELYELGRAGALSRLANPEALINACPGRIYKNLVAVRGRPPGLGTTTTACLPPKARPK